MSFLQEDIDLVSLHMAAEVYSSLCDLIIFQVPTFKTSGH